MSSSDFYLRYYVGHKGKFGHEFLEFEFRPDGEFQADPRSCQRKLTSWVFVVNQRSSYICLLASLVSLSPSVLASPFFVYLFLEQID